jgi:hypothetical protein
MNFFLFSLIFLNYLNMVKCSQLNSFQTVESSLLNNLTANYNKKVRPSEVVTINFSIELKQIISLDEKNQILLTSNYISQEWFDSRLTWNSSDFNKINLLMIPVKDLWIPDTIILNTADADGYLKYSDYSLATVQSDGRIFVIVPATSTRTRCNLDIDFFPFDTHSCKIILTSWAYGMNRNVYVLNDSALNLMDFITNQLWVLKSSKIYADIDHDRNPFEISQNKIIVVQLDLSRKSLYYMINGVMPCLFLNIISILCFMFPFAQQITLSMSIFLTYGIYSIRVSSDLPVQSDYLPTISIYYISSILFTVISVFWFYYFNLMQTSNSIPKFFKNFVRALKKLSQKLDKKKPKIQNKVEIVDLEREKENKNEDQKIQTTVESDKNKTCDDKEELVEKNALNTINISALFLYAVLMLITNLAIWFSGSV